MKGLSIILALVLLTANGILAPSATALSLRNPNVDPFTPPMVKRLEDRGRLLSDFGTKAIALKSIIDHALYWEGYSTLTGCFLSENPEWREHFVEFSRLWFKRIPLAIDFGPAPGYRNCSGTRQEDIRVAFRHETGASGNPMAHWSFTGRDSHTRDHNGASMNINPGLIRNDLDLKVAVLHEMGHALGLEHEHQHPEQRCIDEINFKAAYAFYSSYPQEEVRAMFAILMGDGQGRYWTTPYDKTSIMHYTLSEDLFNNGTQASCYLSQRNETISRDDEAMIVYFYGSSSPIAVTSLQARADESSKVLSTLDLTRTQKTLFGKEIAKVLAAGRRSVAVSFKFAPSSEPGPKAAAPRRVMPYAASAAATTDCSPEAAATGKVSCSLDAAGEQLRITSD